MSMPSYFERAIWLTPQSEILVLVYADWLQEYVGLSRFSALRRGLWVRRERYAAVALAEAARLMRISSRRRNSVKTMLYAHFMDSICDETVYVLKPTGREPRSVISWGPRFEGNHLVRTILIPARWLIEMHAWCTLDYNVPALYRWRRKSFVI